MNQPECPQKMPYIVKETSGEKWWCACGRSKTQPYCDGSHAGTGIEPVQHLVDKDRIVAWCGCKRTARAPLCDGSHSRLG